MSAVFPDLSPVCQGRTGIFVYEKEIVLDEAGEESDIILVPADVQEIVITLDPREGASGTVFTTTDLFKKVQKNDPDVTWVEWPPREESQIYQDYCPKVTAFKFQQIEHGIVKFTMRMQ